MISCVVPLIDCVTTGAIIFGGSEGNFVGNVSFEGNHANASGGKGELKTLFQQYQPGEA